MKLMTLVATFLTLSSLCAQGSPEDGLSRWKDQSVQQQPVDDPLLRWMNKIAQQELQARENAIAQIRTVSDAEHRKQVVREKILQILGGLPDYNGPLHARITGRIQADGYAIEKIIFESLPGFFVTANLYRPNQPGRYPAVLFQSGHTQEGKPEPQRAAANLALKGFVVLCFDPIGQGEREQTYDPQLKGPAAGWSVNEHIHAGAQSILVGESVARYFIWDAKRALDYLLSRPEVDAARVGAVGCSGGGALTMFLGALDSRLKAVVPACFPNSYRLLFAGPDPDSEMSFPELLAHGLDTVDFVELSAPTPWLIQATENDYFTPPGAKLVYDEARRWFGLYGAEDKVGFFVGPGPHGTPLESREAVNKWLIRWLKDGKGDFHEQPVHLYANDELLVTQSGHVEDEPGSRKVYQLILDDFHAKQRPGTILELQEELHRLQVPTDGSSPAVKVLDESSGQQGQRQHSRLASGPGVDVLAARSDVDPTSIRGAARGVRGIWLLLAAAIDPRISKVWLDRTPYSLRAALENSMNTDLFDAVIPSFALQWDLGDLTKAMGNRSILWTDPTNWMGRTVAAGPSYQYRYVIGDTTDLQDEQDNMFITEFIK